MWIGSSLKSKEGRRHVTGQGTFIADVRLPGELQVAFLRSPYGHARIKGIDASEALQQPGVVAVAMGEEFVGSVRPVPEASKILRPGAWPGEMKLANFYPLAIDKAHFMGEPVAVVVAEDRYLAEDAADLIRVDYEPLPVVTNPQQAMQPGSPLVFGDWGDNIAYHNRVVAGDAARVFREASHVFRECFYWARSGYPTLENLGFLASYSLEEGLMLWATTQRPHILKFSLCNVLGLPHNKVRVIAPRDQGGGFGNRAPIHREAVAVCYLARKLGRPVKWIEDRREAMEKGIHERDQTIELEMATDADGTILGLRGKLVADSGSTLIDMYQYLSAAFAVRVPSPYRISNVDIEVYAVATNKAPQGVNRAAARMPFAFAVERMVDIAARELEMDPTEIRLKNLIAEFPYTPSPPAFVMQECDFVGVFRKLLDAVDYEKTKQQIEKWRKEGRFIGLGLGTWTDPAFPVSSMMGNFVYNQPYYASATVRVEPDGTITAISGDSPQGQCRETTVSQAIADELGVHPHDIVCHMGDTLNSPFNNHGVHTQTAAAMAARELRRKIIRIAAHLLDLEPAEEEFNLEGGRVVWKRDETKALPFATVAEVAYMYPSQLPSGMEPGLMQTTFHECPVFIQTGFSAHASIVEAFPESGECRVLKYFYVGDSGRPLNPLLLEGALHGAVSVGVSNAFYEQYVYDEEGRLQTPNLCDYLMPTAMEMPRSMELSFKDVPTTSDVLGFKKGITEGAATAIPAALANALEDALGPFRVRVKELPIRPDKVVALIKKTPKKEGKR